MPSPVEGDAGYVLGHSERELDRLTAQARFIEPITRRFFVEAGIAPGMSVLDVGCGAGDVSFLAAELVGESGEVVGVDAASEPITLARSRATLYVHECTLAPPRRSLIRPASDGRLPTPKLVLVACDAWTG
jgi:SAM-dependent methyltransferase